MNRLRTFPLGPLLLSLVTTRLWATTVVFVVTPTGMVVGADSKTNPIGTATKIFLLKNRLVVADLYAETAKTADGATTLYDFPLWVEQINNNTSSKVSVSEMAEIIKDQMTATFTFVIGAIKRGNVTKEQAVAEGFDAYLVQYIIAGYEKGIPTAYSITLMPGWDTRTVGGPFKVLLNPEEGQNTNSRIFWRGQGVGIKQTMVADTKERKELAARTPVEFQALGNRKNLTLNQASNVARSLLGIEAKANPTYVGFPITLVTIPKTSRASVTTIERDVSPVSGLPKEVQGRKQDKHK